jgi:hypothetical protein
MRSSLLALIALLYLFSPQHVILNVICLYIAFWHGNETDEGADPDYIRVTSTKSIIKIKTSVYVVETIVSDLFIICPLAYP